MDNLVAGVKLAQKQLIAQLEKRLGRSANDEEKRAAIEDMYIYLRILRREKNQGCLMSRANLWH